MSKVGLVLLLLAIGLGIGAVMSWQSGSEFAATAVKAEGTVVELREQTTRDNEGFETTTYVPVVQFATDAGSHTFQHSVGSSPPSYSIGEKVPVLYAPGNPSEAIIDSFMGKFLGALLFGIFAFITGCIGLLFVFLGRRMGAGAEAAA